MDIASRDGISWYEAYGKLFPGKPKPSFIESYMTSVKSKQNTESVYEKRQRQDKWLNIVAIIIGVLIGLAIVAVQVAIAVAGLLFMLLAVVIGAFAISSVFKS